MDVLFSFLSCFSFFFIFFLTSVLCIFTDQLVRANNKFKTVHPATPLVSEPFKRPPWLTNRAAYCFQTVKQVDWQTNHNGKNEREARDEENMKWRRHIMRPFAEMTSKWFDLLSILISFWTNGKASITWLHTSDALLTRSCCNGSIRYALSNSLLSSPFSSDVIPRRLISFNNNNKKTR